jgi:hypothetical protein
VEKSEIRTVAGTGKPGSGTPGLSGTAPASDLALFEPGGLHVADGVLYAADTNNHRVVRLSLSDLRWSEVTIEGLEPPAQARADVGAGAATCEVVPTRLRSGASTEWKVRVQLPDGAHPSDEAPASVRVSRGDEVLLQRTMLGASWPLAFELPAQPEGSADLNVQVSFAYCHEGQGVCVPARSAWNVPVRFEDAGEAAAELTAAVA